MIYYDRIVLGTWNVNSKFPKENELYLISEWLRLDQYEADIYVIG